VALTRTTMKVVVCLPSGNHTSMPGLVPITMAVAKATVSRMFAGLEECDQVLKQKQPLVGTETGNPVTITPSIVGCLLHGKYGDVEIKEAQVLGNFTDASIQQPTVSDIPTEQAAKAKSDAGGSVDHDGGGALDVWLTSQLSLSPCLYTLLKKSMTAHLSPRAGFGRAFLQASISVTTAPAFA